MEYTIKNGALEATVATRGAELRSVTGANGVEYLWDGDSRYWPDRSPVLFPFVARLQGGRYIMDGRQYALPIHGFANFLDFSVSERDRGRIALELESGPETWKMYPRNFIFRVIYELQDNCLSVTYEVENTDPRPLSFGLGGHPGFRVPLGRNGEFEDYRLRFSGPCEPVRVGFTPDLLLSGEDTPYPLEDGQILRLSHGLFDDDAIVLKNTCREVTLGRPGGHGVTVSFPDMPYLGIWHAPKTNAPYVCIEPWLTLPGRSGELTDFSSPSPSLVPLAPGKKFKTTWHITTT